MQSLDINNPGMPDLQFVLFVSALCTSNLDSLNVPPPVRTAVFDRCWSLVNTGPPPADQRERILDLRSGDELTLEACVEAIRSCFREAGLDILTWDHAPSDPTHQSTPAAQPLIDRLQQLYPERPDLVDPPGGHAG